MTQAIHRHAFLLASALACAAPCAMANMLPSPTGPVLLTITGAIENRNAGAEAVFDLAMLRRLPSRDVTTTTIWTEGEITFTGVSLDRLLEHVGATGDIVMARAINDYAVQIPVTDAIPDGALVAYAMDGAPMARRDKGPLWIIYPYDASADFRSEVIFSRSIWQLDRMEIGN